VAELLLVEQLEQTAGLLQMLPQTLLLLAVLEQAEDLV
jgi:hypothetical protein